MDDENVIFELELLYTKEKVRNAAYGAELSTLKFVDSIVPSVLFRRKSEHLTGKKTFWSGSEKIPSIDLLVSGMNPAVMQRELAASSLRCVKMRAVKTATLTFSTGGMYASAAENYQSELQMLCSKMSLENPVFKTRVWRDSVQDVCHALDGCATADIPRMLELYDVVANRGFSYDSLSLTFG